MNVYDDPGGKRHMRMDAIRRIFDEWEGKKILVGDVNAKNVAWGGNTTDERGEDVLEWVMKKGYLIENDCESPATFSSNRGESWVDLTISESVQVNEWRVCVEETMSDHRMIEFSLMGLPKMRRALVANVRGTDWAGVEQMMLGYQPGRLETKEDIDREAMQLQERIKEACMKFIPRSEKVMNTEREWWTVELHTKACKENKEGGTKCEWRRRMEEHRRERNRHKRAIGTARINWLRERVERIQDENPFDRAYRLLNNDRAKEIPSNVLKEDGTYTEGREETSRFLLGKYFPKDDPLRDTPTRRWWKEREEEEWGENQPGFTIGELRAVAEQLFDGKSTGVDGVPNEIIRKVMEWKGECMVELFIACLGRGQQRLYGYRRRTEIPGQSAC
ncbi:uncharacterized protein [Leptinotarsa decemlineata]|uniref:uncharacterized protein n=1 Tax=Leptinotarsa decemlineata TaxID=7539 RepID=UPI003D3098CF